MSLKITAVALAIATATTLIGAPAWAQTASGSTSAPEVKLVAQYETLAGSQRNAESLISGLRDGKNVLLLTNPKSAYPTAPSVTFVPATGKLGYGNINIALSLAKANLARLGISAPTPAQLAAALNGGTLMTAQGSVSVPGVLAQRRDGLGWGQIANAAGANLGSVVSASKTDKAGKKDAADSSSAADSESGAPGKSAQTHSNNGGSKAGNSGSSAGGGSGSSSGHGGSSSSSSSSSSSGGSSGGSSSSGGGGGRGR